MSLSKCIGIISYFPDNEINRRVRKERFNNLLKVLDTYFKLPIVIIAQNWNKEDLKLNYCNNITIHSYKNGLGITKARITLREKLLKLNYDYFIFLDDDSNIRCTQESINKYFLDIDTHPNMFGLFNGRSWPRLLAISKSMLIKMNYDYIKNLDASRGEVWEDIAFIWTYKRIYPRSYWTISINNLTETSPVSKNDEHSTWYRKEFGDESVIYNNTQKIIKKWVASIQKG